MTDIVDEEEYNRRLARMLIVCFMSTDEELRAEVVACLKERPSLGGAWAWEKTVLAVGVERAGRILHPVVVCVCERRVRLRLEIGDRGRCACGVMLTADGPQAAEGRAS